MIIAMDLVQEMNIGPMDTTSLEEKLLFCSQGAYVWSQTKQYLCIAWRPAQYVCSEQNCLLNR